MSRRSVRGARGYADHRIGRGRSSSAGRRGASFGADLAVALCRAVVHLSMVAEVGPGGIERLEAPYRRDRNLSKLSRVHVRGARFLATELLDVPHALGRDDDDIAASLDDHGLVSSCVARS